MNPVPRKAAEFAERKLGARPRGAATRVAALLLCSLALMPASPLAAERVESNTEQSEPGPEVDAADVLFGNEPDPLFDDELDPLFDDFDLDEIQTSFPDPFEKPNRVILVFNRVVDTVLLDPITQVYRFLFPERVRRSINRFFDNVNSPQALVNDMLQLEWTDAGITGARLVINSTVGVAGFFDPAARWGLPRHNSDFDQTLALAGAPSGPYFMLPLLGPTTVRGGVGLGVDALLHPTFFVLGGTDLLFFSGSAGLTERARYYEELKALEESSIDFYAALRSGYYQNRQSEIWSRREHRRPEAAPAAAD